MMAGPRANRFVECVFTAPVRRRDWLAAKFLVLLTLAAAYYIALLPSMLVYTAHVGVPLLLHKYLLWAPGILLAEILNRFADRRPLHRPQCGSAHRSSYGRAARLCGLSSHAGGDVLPGRRRHRTGHITLASPAVLLKNALGFALGGRTILSRPG